MADVVTLIPSRFDFPYMLLPVTARIGCMPLGDVDSEIISLYKAANLFGVNVNWKSEGQFFCGPTTTFSEAVGYNRIAGLDKIQLWLSADSYDQFSHVSDAGFVGTGALYGEIDPIEIERTQLNAMKSIKFDKAFDIGSGLVKKFGIRKGSNIEAYGMITDAPFVATVLYVPLKRDLEPVVVKIITGQTFDELNFNIMIYSTSIDPKGDAYSEKYVTIMEQNKERVLVGFIPVAAHLTTFQYAATCTIAGVTIHTHEEDE